MLYSWTAYDIEDYPCGRGVICADTLTDAYKDLERVKIRNSCKVKIEGMSSDLNTLCIGMEKRPAYTKNDLDDILGEYSTI